MNAKQSYVVGFLFDHILTKVVLILKTKPRWQAGKWNGVGGKIEPGETPIEAMRREFLEETGMAVFTWKHFCVLTGVELRDEKRIEQDFEVHFFCAFSPDIDLAKTQGDEIVAALPVKDMRVIGTVYHLPWLIEMAKAQWGKGNAPLFEIKEVNREN